MPGLRSFVGIFWLAFPMIMGVVASIVAAGLFILANDPPDSLSHETYLEKILREAGGAW